MNGLRVYIMAFLSLISVLPFATWRYKLGFSGENKVNSIRFVRCVCQDVRPDSYRDVCIDERMTTNAIKC